MTQYINSTGKVDPVTIIKAGPCYVTQIKEQSPKTFQIGYLNTRKLNKPAAGHLKGKTLKYLREYQFDNNNESIYLPDAEINVSILDPKTKVDIIGQTKGKGFAGGVKRHGFSIGPKSHGSKHHRRVGSTGCRYPQRTIKGRKMPGRLGNDQQTVKNLSIIKIDTDKHLLIVKGCVPGKNNQLLIIRQK